MDHGKSNLFLPGFELTGWNCTKQRDMVLSCTQGTTHIGVYIVAYLFTVKASMIYSPGWCVHMRSLVTQPQYCMQISRTQLRVLIHSFAFSHTRLTHHCRMRRKAKTWPPVKPTVDSTSPYASPFVTPYTISLRQRSRAWWRTDLRNTPDYPTMRRNRACLIYSSLLWHS